MCVGYTHTHTYVYVWRSETYLRFHSSGAVYCFFRIDTLTGLQLAKLGYASWLMRLRAQPVSAPLMLGLASCTTKADIFRGL